MSNTIIDAIKNRRSIRKYSSDVIPDTLIAEILEAGRWAPSGLNNQPWRFVVVSSGPVKEKVSNQTKYKKIVQSADKLIAVFFHHDSGYNRDKDLMGIGACVQNMLLAAESLSLGAVWLGEILSRKQEINQILEISSEFELMAVIALGYPNETPSRDRKPLEELIIKRI